MISYLIRPKYILLNFCIYPIPFPKQINYKKTKTFSSKHTFLNTLNNEQCESFNLIQFQNSGEKNLFVNSLIFTKLLTEA